MKEKRIIQLSKFLSLVLRHQPETIGLNLNENGWTSVNNLLSKMNNYGKKIDLETLKFVVNNNSKQRFAFNEDQSKIRANQGHSVTVDLGYEPKIPPIILYHGTAEKNLPSILKIGLEKRNRHHVHLSSDISTALSVGKRHGEPIILEVLAKEMYEDGFSFFLSDNGVWLTNDVPFKYLQEQTEQ